MTACFATAQLVPSLGGIEPVRAVTAVAVIQRGVQPGLEDVRVSDGGVRELTVDAEALAGGRRRVLARLAEEAERLGADGVVHVRLADRPVPWLDYGLEVRASGFAVRGLGRDELLMTTLRAGELATLEGAGARPAGLVEHSTVVALLGGPETRNRYRYGGDRKNFEMPDFTRGLAEVRGDVLSSLRAHARSLGANGLLALDLALEPRWDHVHRRRFSESVVVLEARALATAIVDLSGESGSEPRLVLDLRRTP